MVKNYLFSAILLIAFSSIFAQSSPDSILVKERNDLFQTYSNDKATKPDPKKEDLMTQVSSLENIINKDNVMIDSLLSYSNSMKVLMERIDTLAKTESSLTEAQKNQTKKSIHI